MQYKNLQVEKELVLSRCDYLVDIQTWPVNLRLNPRRWFENFREDEQPHAASLLNAFVYFNSLLCERLLVAAVQNLSREFRDANHSFAGTQERWRRFIGGVVVTSVTGEEPNPTDSGYTFLRLARQALGISQDRIVEPKTALNQVLDNAGSHVLFLDDFVGSGQQFIHTWTRLYETKRGSVSFKSVSPYLRNSGFYYCPLVCTERGRAQITSHCPGVSLAPAHFLPRDYSAVAPDSVIWPSDLRESGPRFVEKVSARAGIANWKGFHELGLAIAFEHSVPDATLPLFSWNENGWKPLIERR